MVSVQLSVVVIIDLMEMSLMWTADESVRDVHLVNVVIRIENVLVTIVNQFQRHNEFLFFR